MNKVEKSPCGWYRMCSCQITVGQHVLNCTKYFYVKTAYFTLGLKSTCGNHTLLCLKILYNRFIILILGWCAEFFFGGPAGFITQRIIFITMFQYFMALFNETNVGGTV
jgi:hypothetical protein